MKKLIGFFTSALFVSSLLITPASANNNNGVMPEKSYNTCTSCTDEVIVMPESKNKKR